MHDFPILVSLDLTNKQICASLQLQLLFFWVLLLQIIIACRKGGTSIEDLAEKFPDMIVKVCCSWQLALVLFKISIQAVFFARYT